MTKQLFGLKLVETTLDPIPRKMRTAPGVLVVSPGEAEMVRILDVPTIQYLLRFVLDDEMERAEAADAAAKAAAE